MTSLFPFLFCQIGERETQVLQHVFDAAPVEELLDNTQDGTLLHEACALSGPNWPMLFRFLLRDGFDVNERSRGDGKQALHAVWLVLLFYFFFIFSLGFDGLSLC